MSARIEITTVGDEELARRLLLLERPDFDAVLEAVGALVESQTRRRLQDEKTSPEGERWAPWSESYERTRGAHHSLLINEGDLRDSVQFRVNGDELEVGSNLGYASTHQFGDRRLGFGRAEVVIPARPFLGLSDANEDEVVAVIEDLVAEALR